MPISAPLTVTLTRHAIAESAHIVHAAITDDSGALLAAYGDADRLTFPRSTLKLLQTIPLVESGAAAAYGLSEAEIALASASHSGEPKHIDAVRAWLQRLGFDETVLECGAHAPAGKPATEASILANNCSGKHAGMLTLSLFLKADPKGYTLPDHPVQRAILGTIGDMCGCPITPHICGIDGCSAPNPALPLKNLALGMAKFMKPDQLSFARGAACKTIYQAMTAHADLVGGNDRLDTVLMQSASGAIVSKVGAEGVYIALIPNMNRVVALKTEDGALRAAQAALYAILKKHQLADASTLEAIRPLCLPILKNWRGLEVGDTQVHF